MVCVYGNGGCFAKPPAMPYYSSFAVSFVFVELRLIAAGGTDRTLTDLQEIKTYCYGFHRIVMSIWAFFSFSCPPTFFHSSLFSPPLLLSRAVMGLDRESDVVHIETRIGKGREYCTPVCCSSKTHRTPCLSFRARSRARWDLFFCSDWSLKSSKAE